VRGRPLNYILPVGTPSHPPVPLPRSGGVRGGRAPNSNPQPPLLGSRAISPSIPVGNLPVANMFRNCLFVRPGSACGRCCVLRATPTPVFVTRLVFVAIPPSLRISYSSPHSYAGEVGVRGRPLCYVLPVGIPSHSLSPCLRNKPKTVK
jgi:hypothetical protein